MPSKTGALLRIFIPIVLVFSALLAMTAPAAALTKDQVSVRCGPGYWASLSDYNNRLLSVDYQVGNISPGNIYNVTMTAATANNGVTVASAVPVWMGDTDPGVWNTINLKWTIPGGVYRFRTTVSICSTCSPSICVGEETSDGGINIKPGSCPNSINLNSGGLVSVAVYSYGTFDALTIDASTVLFAGAAPVRNGAEDVDGDGRLDNVFKFDRDDLGGLVDQQRACLSASITGGGSYRSCDSVRIVQS